jgi:hypothetical protein
MHSLVRIRMAETRSTLPTAKSIIDAAGSWCGVVCREGTPLNVPIGHSADADVGWANDEDEMLGRDEAAECDGSKGPSTTGIDE